GHAVAEALRSHAATLVADVPTATGHSVSPGHGISAEVDGERIALGSPAFMDQLGAQVPATLSSVVEAAAGEGRSTVLVARDTEVRSEERRVGQETRT